MTTTPHPVILETNQDFAAQAVQALDGVLRSQSDLDPSEDTLVLSALRTSLRNLLDEARSLDTMDPSFR
jgi:hypothetical protein